MHRRPVSKRPVLLILVLFLIACAGTPPPKRQPHPALEASWGRYLQAARQRAFAVAGDLDGEWTGGIVGGTLSPMDAEREALELCERKRVAKRIPGECKLYAVGTRIVWEGEVAEPTSK